MGTLLSHVLVTASEGNECLMRARFAAVAVAVSAGLALAGCGTRAAPGAGSGHSGNARADSRPAPSASTSAPGASSPPGRTPVHLAAVCATGVEDQTAHVFHRARSVGTPGNLVPAGDVAVGAYRVTVTNDSRAGVRVTGFAVVFRSYSGARTGSARQRGLATTIPPGRSFTWTETPWGAITSAPFAAGRTGAIDTRSTCHVTALTRR